MREAFEKTEDPIFFLGLALKQVSENQWSLPRWLMEEVNKILFEHRQQIRSQRPARGERSAEEKAKQLTVDLYRFLVVKRLKERGIPHLELWQTASDALAKTEHYGSADSIRRSYYAMDKLVDVGSDGVGFSVSRKRV